MTLRTVAQFNHSFPDDSIEGEDEFIRWPGLNTTEALAEIVRQLGYECGEPEDLQYVGWELDFKVQTQPICLRFNDVPGRCILYVIGQPKIGPFWHRRTDPAFVDFLHRFSAALESDPRFFDIVWYVFGRRGQVSDPLPADEHGKPSILT